MITQAYFIRRRHELWVDHFLLTLGVVITMKNVVFFIILVTIKSQFLEAKEEKILPKRPWQPGNPVRTVRYWTFKACKEVYHCFFFQTSRQNDEFQSLSEADMLLNMVDWCALPRPLHDTTKRSSEVRKLNLTMWTRKTLRFQSEKEKLRGFNKN